MKKKPDNFLDYQERTGATQLQRICRRIWWGVCIVLAAAIIFPVVVFSIWIRTERGKIRAFEAKTDQSLVVGKSINEVKGILGAPYESATYSNEIDLIYKGPSDDFCRIEFQNDRAVRVVRWSK